MSDERHLRPGFFRSSGAPKDKKIHLACAYACADSRNNPTPGLQIDDIKVFDDGL